MKKKALLLTTAAIMAVTTALAAAMASSWVCVQDSCKKCVMTDTTRKCGKCGSFMASVGKGEYKDGGYVQYTYKCNNENCGHTCVYKNK